VQLLGRPTQCELLRGISSGKLAMLVTTGCITYDRLMSCIQCTFQRSLATLHATNLQLDEGTHILLFTVQINDR
jgi:hypothetical protein